MAGFKDLPDDLAFEILNVVSLEDLENFAQICKGVYLLARPILQRHRQRIRLYTKLISDSSNLRTCHTADPDGFQLGPIPSLLRDVVNEPCIGRYIRYAKLDSLITTYSRKGKESGINVRSDEARSLYHRQRDLVEAVIALSDAPNLQSFYYRETGPDFYPNHGYEELLIAFSLSLLPNLNRLSIVWDPKLRYFREMIRRSALDGSGWFNNISTVHLRTRPGFYRLWLSDLRLFTTLPALKSLTAFRVFDSGGTTSELLRSQSRHMKSLKLMCSNVTRKRLYWYLASFQNIQTFAFSYINLLNEIVGRTQFDPNRIRAALLARNRATLRSLTILGPTGHNTYMGSLQPFKALRKICIEWEFLYPGQIYLETWPSSHLPASLRELQLRDNSNRSCEDYRLLFRGLRDAKVSICLHLELVDIGSASEKRHKVEELDYLDKFCKGKGLSLNFQKESPTFHGSSQMSLTFDADILEIRQRRSRSMKSSSTATTSNSPGPQDQGPQGWFECINRVLGFFWYKFLRCA